jgi:hypothetical protein
MRPRRSMCWRGSPLPARHFRLRAREHITHLQGGFRCARQEAQSLFAGRHAGSLRSRPRHEHAESERRRAASSPTGLGQPLFPYLDTHGARYCWCSYRQGAAGKTAEIDTDKESDVGVFRRAAVWFTMIFPSQMTTRAAGLLGRRRGAGSCWRSMCRRGRAGRHR